MILQKQLKVWHIRAIICSLSLFLPKTDHPTWYIQVLYNTDSEVWKSIEMHLAFLPSPCKYHLWKAYQEHTKPEEGTQGCTRKVKEGWS